MSTQAELVQAVAAFAPDHVVRSIVDGHPPRPGEVVHSEGAALFVDVAGFTPMAERLVRIMRDEAHHAEPRGAEELNRIINRVFSAMMTVIQRHGGAVARFSGDALTAYFARPANLSAADVVASVVGCAQAMQRAILPFAQINVRDEIFPISVKIGIGYGPAILLTVGDEQRNMESVLAGRALDEATAAETHAERGQVVLGPTAWELLQISNIKSQTPNLKYQISNGYYVAPPFEQDVAPLPERDNPLADLTQSKHQLVLQHLAPYLPRPIYDRVLLAQGDLPGDYRRVTNIFVFFDGLDYDTPDVGEKAQTYYRWVYAIVERYGGRLIRMLSDDKGSSLHILFGAPDKHADDPARGLRCALALQRDTSRPAFITKQRIGVASGSLFAATIGSATRREYTVIGNEVNLSARLTSVCTPGEILVDVYTRDRTAQQFEFETLPPMQLKGKSHPVIAHRLLVERPAETGLVARYLSSRWRIVGRDAEVTALLRAADQALSGSGHIIAVEGRAGVGKTRLIEEVVRHWVEHKGDGFIGQAVSHGLNFPYHIWANFWHAFFGFSQDDNAERRWEKAQTVVAHEAPDVAQWLGILAPVLGLPDVPLPSSLDAADRRRKLFEVSLRLLTARAEQGPLLMLFEDLHWADRPSLELIDYVGQRIGQVPVLLCVCFRPREDFELEILSSMHCTWRVLGELQADQSAELVQAILGEVELPPRLEREIYDRTQGNPLFVEEIVNSLIVSGVLAPENGHYRLADDPGNISIPDTLQDLLMARIDRLEAPSRDLVQVASVIDRRFPFAILRGIYPYPMSNLEMQERLNELIRPEDLTRLERPEPDLIYLFKHALTREVAYTSLPFSRRQQLHQRAGEFIESTYADRLEEHYSTLAYHFDQSKQWERALIYALSAGVQAQAVYANDEAMRYYHEVETYLARLPIQVYWINALQMVLKRSVLHRLNGDYHLAEADLARALELAQTHNDTRAQVEAYCLLADLYYYQMHNEESLAAAEKAHAIASQHNHHAELNTSLVQLGIACQMLGDIDRSMNYLQQAHDLAEERGDQLTLARALNTMGVAWWLYQGELDKALNSFNRVLEIRREAGAKDREAECLANIANVQFRRGGFEAALEASQEALRVGKEAGWHYGLSYVQLDQADVYCYLGDYQTGQRLIEEAKDNLALGDDLGQAYVRLWMGRNIHLDLGHDDLAVPALQASLEFMQAHDHYEEMIRALTALGASCLRQKDLAQARSYLEEAHQLSLSQHFPWQRSEIRYRLGEVALAEDRLDEASDWARRGIEAVAEGSGPDWLGPIHLLLARIAQRQNAPLHQVMSHCQQAISLAHTRCRAVERAWVQREAGNCLAAHLEGQELHQAQASVQQAEAWLAERGISR